MLRLDKLPPPVRTLEEILAESESETDQRNDNDDGDEHGEALRRDREETGSRDAPASEEADKLERKAAKKNSDVSEKQS